MGGAGGAGDADLFQYPATYSVDPKNWDIKNWAKLDIDQRSTFGPWFTRAHRWLHGGAPAMRRLLERLQFEAQPLTPERELTLCMEAGLPTWWHVQEVDRALAEAIVRVSHDSVAALSERLGEERGMELYRFLYAKFRGAGPFLAQAGIEAVMQPRR